MNGKIHLGWILGIGLCSGLAAETIKPGQSDSDAVCGQNLRMRDVLVLDLEPLRSHPDKAEDFVGQHAGEYRLVKVMPEEIRTRSRPSRDPASVTRAARKLGVQKGCDLVLVLRTGPYFGRQRSIKARTKEQGYAFVVMGQRTASMP